MKTKLRPFFEKMIFEQLSKADPSGEHADGIKEVALKIQENADLCGKFVRLAQDPEVLKNDKKLLILSSCLNELIICQINRVNEVMTLRKYAIKQKTAH